MNGSPPTTCRPGVVSAVEPANGSVSRVNSAASDEAGIPATAAASATALTNRRNASARHLRIVDTGASDSLNVSSVVHTTCVGCARLQAAYLEASAVLAVQTDD